MRKEEKHSFLTVTETPGVKASQEQLERLYIRYRFASEYSSGKEVLEVACGAGLGLGYIAKNAKSVVGGDVDEENLKFAREHYKDRPNIELRQLDAHQLPFKDSSFDIIILYEAIYYLDFPERFVKESLRVLKNGGILLICTVNKDWSDFNPSPYSQKYFSAHELYMLLNDTGFINIKLYADSFVNSKTFKDNVISLIKRSAAELHLIPSTMKGKELLKRVFFGSLKPLPRELYDGMASYRAPVLISPDIQNFQFKILFALGYKQ